MRIFGKNKKEKGWGTGDDFIGTVSGGGGGGGGGGGSGWVSRYKFQLCGIFWFPPPRPPPPPPPPVNTHPIPSIIVLTRQSVPVGPGLGGVGGHGGRITFSKEFLGASGVLSY